MAQISAVSNRQSVPLLLELALVPGLLLGLSLTLTGRTEQELHCVNSEQRYQVLRHPLLTLRLALMGNLPWLPAVGKMGNA